MKRLLLFNSYILGAFLIFQAFLLLDKSSAVSVWVSAHQIYLSSFVFLNAVFFAIFVYIKYKRVRAKVSPEAWAAGNLLFKSHFVKSKKQFAWTTVSLIVFLGCIQIILFSHLSERVSILLTTGFTVVYIVGITAASWIVRVNNKLKLEKATLDHENVNLKLKSIRSQLNPHFMFNALTSIQNLINKNDITAANQYLTLFADLTRRVLNTSDQDLISLADELQIQQDYLQMEQLRFGFKYEVKVDEAINTANTEIPAMLLQPFVENAVKHGIAVNPQSGVINVTIDKKGNNLILAVTDNGKGFDQTAVQNQKTSFGLKLSEQRIELLNQLYKDQPVTLNIDSTPGGTCVIINLIDLLA